MISRRQFLRGDFGSRSSTPRAGEKQLAVIGNACIAFNNAVCRSCGDACAEAAIRFSPRLGGSALPEVIAERCTACGECIPACPTQAIRLG